ncbi:peptide deformylase [Candidatus Peregrinibacteria bacterium]|nr:peptide deformylase [Candidatus Peregrinibacteria bacterium]
MAILKIITGEDNKILRTRSSVVLKFDARLKKFARDLKETMIKRDGLGLASPQVAQNIRVIVVTFNYKRENERIVAMVNPDIVEKSDEMEIGEEGCLSLPGRFGKVTRHKMIVVEFSDLEGIKQVLKLAGLNARVVQHECDHLDGVLFVDKMVKGEKEENLLI